jgi:hypothetical protein
MHWIQLPNLTEHRRAIGALLDVYREYQVLPDSQFVVTDEHIKALQKAKVRFKYLSRTARNGQKSNRSRS